MKPWHLFRTLRLVHSRNTWWLSTIEDELNLYASPGGWTWPVNIPSSDMEKLKLRPWAKVALRSRIGAAIICIKELNDPLGDYKTLQHWWLDDTVNVTQSMIGGWATAGILLLLLFYYYCCVVMAVLLLLCCHPTITTTTTTMTVTVTIANDDDDNDNNDHYQLMDERWRRWRRRRWRRRRWKRWQCPPLIMDVRWRWWWRRRWFVWWPILLNRRTITATIKDVRWQLLFLWDCNGSVASLLRGRLLCCGGGFCVAAVASVVWR